MRANNGELLPYISHAPIQAGDYIHIEPCAVHALTAGSFVYEIEHGIDNTFRLFDYGRTDVLGKQRELHVDEAIESLDSTLKATARAASTNFIISEKYYALQLLKDVSIIKNVETTFTCFTLLSGYAVIDGIKMNTGMSVVLEPGEVLKSLNVESGFIAKTFK